MSRVGFWNLFTLNPDGSIRPLKPIKIAGVVLDTNQSYPKGTLFSGWDIFQFLGRDLELDDRDDNPPIVTGVY